MHPASYASVQHGYEGRCFREIASPFSVTIERLIGVHRASLSPSAAAGLLPQHDNEQDSPANPLRVWNPLDFFLNLLDGDAGRADLVYEFGPFRLDPRSAGYPVTDSPSRCAQRSSKLSAYLSKRMAASSTKMSLSTASGRTPCRRGQPATTSRFAANLGEPPPAEIMSRRFQPRLPFRR